MSRVPPLGTPTDAPGLSGRGVECCKYRIPVGTTLTILSIRLNDQIDSNDRKGLNVLDYPVEHTFPDTGPSNSA